MRSVQVDDVEGFTSPYHTVLTAFAMMMGDFSAEPYDDEQYFELRLILAALFMLFVTVVMLNMLIAIMGDSYDQVGAWHH